MIEILISTMNQKDDSLINKMNIHCNSLIINQCSYDSVKKKDAIRIINTTERGLSKSRNMAIENSIGDICIIADDDLVYSEHMVTTVEKAYDKYKDASIIAFYVKSETSNRPTSRPRHEGYLNKIDTMKLASFMITFKREDIISNNITFNPNFGAGSGCYCAGEENILLIDCINKGLKIVYVDKTIATVSHNESTWWSETISCKNIHDLGAAYYLMFPKIYLLMGIQYIVRKRKRFDKDLNFIKSMHYYIEGTKSIKKRKIFIVGDVTSSTGPGIANRILVDGLKKNKTYLTEASNQGNIISRLLELPFKIKRSNYVVINSFSKINYIILIICKIFKKKSLYILHGYVEYEEKMNKMVDNSDLKKIHKLENYIFENVDKIVCVSKKCMVEMKKLSPKYVDKYRFMYNGFLMDIVKSNNKKNDDEIVSTTIGGGMIRKNTVGICMVIENIIDNNYTNKKIKLNVIGKKYTEYDKINTYNFVNYYEYLEHNDVLNILENTDIYIQNSIFETFGLSIIEAFECGCKIIMTEICGCIDCFQNLSSENIIKKNDDIDTISKKIINLYEKESDISIIDLSEKNTARRFEKILEEIR